MDTALIQEQLRKVVEDFRTGEFDSAARLLERILAVSAPHPDLLHLGAMIAIRRRDDVVAHDHAERAVAARPESTAFRYTYAQSLNALGRYDEAIAELRHILTIDPGFHRAHVRIWETMGMQGRMSDATRLVKQRLSALGDAGAMVAGTERRTRIRDTTLCCIDCSNPALATRALRLSLAGCEFSRAILLTDRELDAASIETIVIDPIRSLEQYSHFVAKKLVDYIDTGHVLLIQWDGYVVNPAAWSDEFLNFDYIGARWPHEALGIPAEHAVGNGGFSLRSKALLEALQDPKISDTHPEDEATCITYRRYLEKAHGIEFAPAEVADRFSFEHVRVPGTTFGFHGQINVTRFVDDVPLRMLEIATRDPVPAA